MPRGGKRPGAGLPRGFKFPKTLEKEAAREFTRQLVTAELPELVGAQIAHAKGIQHFVLRTKDGKFEKVTSADAALAAMNDPDSVYEFWEKDPSVQAFTDLLNRALDKPKEQEQEIKLTGEVQLVARLMRARKRLS